MATSDQAVLLDFARGVLSEKEYNTFVRLLYLREDENPHIRAQANVELTSILAKLKTHFAAQQKPYLHAV